MDMKLELVLTGPDGSLWLARDVHHGQPPDNYMDTARLRADTGFQLEYDVARAVPDYAAWLRKHDR
jgi:nucleoside-diphosphate-sugar epimerase